MRTLTTLGAAAAALALSAAPALAGSCSGSGSHSHSHETTKASWTQKSDIVDVAAAAGSFETLLAAAKSAGLVDALKGDGPLTVFAPTDDAFAKLPAGTVESLLEPKNRDELTAILTYHVASGEVQASDVVNMSRVATLNGQAVPVKVSGSAVMLGDSRVVQTDIEASNGVIHVIDSVLMPSSNDIVETAVAAGSFKTLAAALQAADLVGALQGEGPFTVFAPTDEAFAALPAGTVESLLKPENRDKLTTILTYHVVPGRLYSEDVLAGADLTTLQGKALGATMKKGSPRIDDAGLVAVDIGATNGVIHVIDSVLMPTDDPRESAMNIIEGAVERGAPLYNMGQHAACVAVYEMAAQSLVEMGGDALTRAEQMRLVRAMRESARSSSADDSAWAMRHALDDVHASLATSPAMTTARR